MKINTIYQGHNLKIIRSFPAATIDMLLCSPPYWGLRNYKTEGQLWGGKIGCDHKWIPGIKRGISGGTASPKVQTKQVNNFQKVANSSYLVCGQCDAWKGELGQEPIPQQYIHHLIELFTECKRVLKPWGTMWINIGDTYAGSGGAGGDWTHGARADEPKWKQGDAAVKDKSLVGIPFRFAIAMIDAGFILRNTIIWWKRNCMPSSAEDRFTVDFEYFFLFSMQGDYYFKQQLEYVGKVNRYGGTKMSAKNGKIKTLIEEQHFGKSSAIQDGNNLRPHGNYRNKRCVWDVRPESFKGAHFAVMPTKLCKSPIDASCPKYVCPRCGKPQVYIVEKSSVDAIECPPIGGINKLKGFGNPTYSGNTSYKLPTGGHWQPQCECNAGWNPGIVFDPFMGSGTSGLQALKAARNFVGIELNPEYVAIAKARLSPYLKQKRLF